MKGLPVMLMETETATEVESVVEQFLSELK